MTLKHSADVIIFDGQGIAHPRGMGVAAHLGILLGKPSMGCAKTWLYGDYTEPAGYRGAFSYLLGPQGSKIGVVLRTRDNVRPVYVSVGHKIDIENSMRIILMCTIRFRLPEPLRLAHHLARKFIACKNVRI